MKAHDSVRSFGNVAAMLLLLASEAVTFAPHPQAHPPDAATRAQKPNLTACSSDGEFYALATPKGRIKCGRTQEGADTRALYQCHPRAMAFSPDGRWLAVAGGSNGCPAQLKVWNVTDGTVLCQWKTELESDPILSFSPDGRLLASTCEGGRINVWQLPEGTLRCTLTDSRSVARLAFTQEGQDLVTVGADGNVQRFPLP